MNYLSCLSILLILPLWSGCSLFGSESSYNPEVEPGVYRFDFETEAQGWTPIFVGYFVGGEEGFNLSVDHRSLPEQIDGEQKGLFISGDNQSDGLGMHFKRRIEGLEANTLYRLTFEVEIASQVGSGCGGLGGSPGESVNVVAAALSTEPAKTKEGNVYDFNKAVQKELRLPYDQSQPPVLGNIANDLSCEESLDRGQPFRLKRLESTSDYWTVRTDEAGRAWLLVGTSSGFEGITSLYYNEITVYFEQ